MKGRFIDETDPECKRYFLCSQKKNGVWVKTTYNCPETANFDPDLGYCTSTALCAFSTTTSTKVTEVTETTEVTDLTTTSNWETTEITVTTMQPSNTNYTCEKEGRYPDKTACDCGWFYDCKYYQQQLVSTRLYCPPNTKFDPELSVCSPNYHCIEEFVCKEEGNFLDILNPSNNTYYTCEQMEDGSFLQTHYNCLPNMVFNETLEICVDAITSTTPNDDLTTDSILSTTTDLSPPSKPFNCTDSGRFSDPNDLNCKEYYLCVDLQAFHYTCPIDMNFNPHVQECQTDYKCPIETVTEKWESTFHCQKRGYFKNSNDSSMKSYFFCDVLGDGKIYQYELMCPVAYSFDETTNLCNM